MKISYRMTIVSLLLALLLPHDTSAQIGNNEIGIYTAENPDRDAIDDYTSITGVAGVFYTAYVVCLDPYNQWLDRPIANVSGAEFNLTWGDLVVNYELPPGGFNFKNPPDFHISADPIPVVDGACTLLTLHIGSYTAEPVEFFISPPQSYNPAFAEGIALTDSDDFYSISQAYPSSGAFELPVFGFNTSVVPSEGKSWGDVKGLFR